MNEREYQQYLEELSADIERIRRDSPEQYLAFLQRLDEDMSEIIKEINRFYDALRSERSTHTS